MAACIGGTRHNQQGLALITAVLVVAIVATVATTLALGEQVWFRQAQNMANRAQAESLRQGALNYAAILLARDDAKIDHLGEPWAKPLPPLPVEDGMITFTVSDAQSRFNLNNLVRAGGTPSPADREMFQRLLTSQGLDPGLSNALVDWMDLNNDVTSPGGAEDIDYLSLPQPYRSARQPLQSVDELRLVKGFSVEIVEKLRPYVTALPVHTTVNVHTAPEQVLAALFVNTPASAALQTVLDSRVSQPFADSAQFIARLPAGTPQPPPSLYGINTGYFLVTIDIRYGRLQRSTEALIERVGGKPATVLWHRLPPPQLITKPDEKT
jgi:general secretion pathway protein K